MMIVGGENVFPFEIESVLCDHPAVAEAAVLGMPDDIRGELPVAFVLLHENATADETELRSFCRERLAGYKVPREIRVEKDLPRSPTGKILKRALIPKR
jgi:feruloyl-CoA synthase